MLSVATVCEGSQVATYGSGAKATISDASVTRTATTPASEQRNVFRDNGTTASVVVPPGHAGQASQNGTSALAKLREDTVVCVHAPDGPP